MHDGACEAPSRANRLGFLWSQLAEVIEAAPFFGDGTGTGLAGGAVAAFEPGTVALERGIDEFAAADDDAVSEVFAAIQEEFALDGETGFTSEGSLGSFADAGADDFSVFPETRATSNAEHLPVVDEGATVALLPLGEAFLRRRCAQGLTMDPLRSADGPLMIALRDNGYL
jgi:hypothetical protein